MLDKVIDFISVNHLLFASALGYVWHLFAKGKADHIADVVREGARVAIIALRAMKVDLHELASSAVDRTLKLLTSHGIDISDDTRKLVEHEVDLLIVEILGETGLTPEEYQSIVGPAYERLMAHPVDLDKLEKEAAARGISGDVVPGAFQVERVEPDGTEEFKRVFPKES